MTTPSAADVATALDAIARSANCCHKPHDCKWGGTGGCGDEGAIPSIHAIVLRAALDAKDAEIAEARKYFEMELARADALQVAAIAKDAEIARLTSILGGANVLVLAARPYTPPPGPPPDPMDGAR